MCRLTSDCCSKDCNCAANILSMVSPLAASVFSIETASSLTSIGTSTCHCISIDLDFSAASDGVNANIYTISPQLHGSVFSKDADYCDGGGNTSKPAGKGGYCLEVDWIESNGKCGGATAIHDVPGRNTSRSPLGCNAAGCRKEYLYKASTIHMRAEYDAAGRLTLTHENQTITPKQWVPLPVASDWSVTERSYASLGAVIYSSQWIGWAPAQALGCIDPHSCNLPAPGNCSAVLASSTYTVSNLEVFGTVVQGPVPTVCKADDEQALRSSVPLHCTAASDFPQQTTFHAFNPDAAGHTAHLNDANVIFEYRGIYHIMAQHGGGNWSHQVSNDLVRWWSLPDALDGNASSSWNQDTCDGVVSFPDLGRAPYNGSTPVMLSDLTAADYNLTHHHPSSGDTAATCQSLCDADERCAAWVWVVRGLPAGTADVKKALPFRRCPAQPRPHPCKPCTLTSGVKTLSNCNMPRPPAVAFDVELLKGESSMDVRIIMDRLVVEVFVQGGRRTFVAASNFSVGRASVHLVNDGAVAVAAIVNASGMGCGWANALPLPASKSARVPATVVSAGVYSFASKAGGKYTISEPLPAEIVLKTDEQLRFSRARGSRMMLPQTPARANVWGFGAEPGRQVVVTLRTMAAAGRPGEIGAAVGRSVNSPRF